VKVLIILTIAILLFAGNVSAIDLIPSSRGGQRNYGREREMREQIDRQRREQEEIKREMERQQREIDRLRREQERQRFNRMLEGR